MNSMRASIEANNAKMAAMQSQMVGAAAVGYGLYRAIKAPVAAAIEFESAMADVKKVVDFPTPDAFNEMSAQIRELSTRIPIAATGIADIVAAAGQANIAREDLLGFTEIAAKVAVAFDMTAGDVGEALAKIKTQLNISVADTGELADAINQLSNTSASSAPDLVNFMKRVAAAGEQYGFTAQQTAAIGSAMIASGAEAEVAATSFRNVGRALAKGETATENQQAAFHSLGLSAGQVAKDLQKDAVGTLRDVLQRVKRLPEHLQANTISTIFGDEARAIAPVVNNIELYDKALASVADRASYLGSAQKEYEARAATTANNLQLFANKIEALGIAVGSALLPALNATMDAIGPVVMAMARFADANPVITRSIIGLTAALIGLRVASIAARYSFLWIKGGVLSAGLRGLQVLQAVMTVAKGGARALVNPLKLVRGALIALRAVALASGIGLAIGALALSGAWLYNNWKNVAAAFDAFKGSFLEAIKPIRKVLAPAIDLFDELSTFITGLVAPVEDAEDAFARFGDNLGGRVGRAVRRVVETFRDLPRIISDAFTFDNVASLPGRIVSGLRAGFAAAWRGLTFAFDWAAKLVGPVDWQGVGRTILDGLRTGLDAGWSALTIAWDWAGKVAASIDWARVAGSVASGVSQALSLAWAGVTVTWDWTRKLLTGVDWSAAGSAIATGIGRAVSAAWQGVTIALDWARALVDETDWGALGKAAAASLHNAASAALSGLRLSANWVADLAVSFSESDLAQSVRARIAAIDWGVALAGAGTALGSAFKASVAAALGAVSLTGELLGWIARQVQSIDAVALGSSLASVVARGFSAGLAMVGSAMSALTDGGSGAKIGESLLAGLRGVLSAGRGIVESLIRSWFKFGAGFWLELLQPSGAAIAKGLGDGVTGAAVADSLRAKFAAIDWGATMAGAGAAIGKAIMAGWQTYFRTLNMAGELLSWLSTQIASIDAASLGKSIAEVLVKGVSGGIRLIGSAIASLGGEGGAGGEGLASGLVNAMRGALSGGGELVASIVRKWFEFGAGFWSEALSSSVEEIRTVFANVDLAQAGRDAIQSLLDGMKAKLEELIAWAKALPGRIREAIGNIDLSNIISMPSLPTWLGGGEAEESARAAAEPARQARAVAMDEPVVPPAGFERILEVAREVAALQSEVVKQAFVSHDDTAATQLAASAEKLKTLTADLPASARESIDAYVAAIAQGGGQVSAEADAIAATLKERLNVTVQPKVDLSSINAATQAANEAAAAVKRLNAGATGAANAARASMPNIPGRASGGPVAAGSLYEVGERGRELFVPPVNGHIVNARDTAALMKALARPAMAMSSIVPPAMPQPRAIPASFRGGAGGGDRSAPAPAAAPAASGPVSVTFGDIHVHGGSNASAADLRAEFGREASALMRSRFTDGAY